MKNMIKNIHNIIKVSAVFSLLVASFISFADSDNLATLRKGPLASQTEPNVIPKVNNKDIKQQRNYPMQPPIIPHTTRQYQVNLNSNKCMSCHSRQRTEESQAPMVSVTHYMDRDGNFLAEISPRRYFCNQCHVPQLETDQLIDNDFVDMHSLMKLKSADKK